MSGLTRRTPLVAKTGLTRKTALTAGTGLASGGGLTRRTPVAAAKGAPAKPRRRDAAPKTATATGPNPATRELVLVRDVHACVRCTGPLDAWFGYSLQHRIGRGAGGRSGELATYLNSAVNLISLCGSGTTGCHGWVEAHPAEADQFGWSVPSWADPATWPVYLAGAWVLLDTVGHRTFITNTGTWSTADQFPGVRRLEERVA